MKKHIFILLIIGVIFFSCKTNNNTKEMTENKTEFVKTTPEWSKKSNIYEVNIRQYTEKGTITEFTKHIKRLKDMGVDILWIMPVQPIGEKNRKGKLGSYYSIKNYTEVNPDFGTLQDFKDMVDTAHKYGMHVILDWVANHSAFDNVWTKKHPDWYTRDSSGNIICPPGTDWTDVADLNYDNQQMRKEMIKSMEFWLKNTDIDGFRCDVAGMVPLDFWIQARQELEKIKPVFMLAEWDTPEMHKAFDMTYAWDFHHLINDIAQGKKNAADLDSFFTDEAKKYDPQDYRMRFTSNHDENSWNGTEYERMGDSAAITFAVLTYLVPGMPLIYSGQEEPLKKRLSFFDKDTINFGSYKLQNFYTTLNSLKTNNKALWNGTYGGNFVKLKSDENNSVFAFVRKKDDNKILAIFNLSDSPVYYDINNQKGIYYSVFEDAEINLSSDIYRIRLKPWQYIVLIKK